MESFKLEKTASMIQARSQKSNGRACIFFSGGKDSLALTHLLRQYYNAVVAIHWYIIPNGIYLNIVKKKAEELGAIFVPLPHHMFIEALKNSVYRLSAVDIEIPAINDYIAYVREEFGLHDCYLGYKKSDSMQRRYRAFSIDGIYPLWEWTKFDVLDYCERYNLVPIKWYGINYRSDGIGIDNKSILFLYDNYREDYEKLKLYFPLIDAVVKRREYYGNIHDRKDTEKENKESEIQSESNQ